MEMVSTRSRSPKEDLIEMDRTDLNSVDTKEALAVGSIWPTLLQTRQRSVDALQYQSDKMDTQLNPLALYVAGIDEKLSDLN